MYNHQLHAIQNDLNEEHSLNLIALLAISKDRPWKIILKHQ